VTSKIWSQAVVVAGMIVLFLQQSAPDIQKQWPNIKWIGPGIAMVGFIWQLVQKFMDRNKITIANYTPPGGGDGS
jgi:hypothetical protein